MDMQRLIGWALLTLPIMAVAIPAEASLDLLARIAKSKDIKVPEYLLEK